MLLTSSTVHHSEQTPATHEISLSVATNQSHAFHIQGETERCDDLIRTANHVFVCISPFNSRFSKEYVTALVQWAWNHFSTVDILLPSEEDAARLLVASGTPMAKALKKPVGKFAAICVTWMIFWRPLLNRVEPLVSFNLPTTRTTARINRPEPK